MKNVPKLTWFMTAIAIFLAGNLVFTGCKKDDINLVPKEEYPNLKWPEAQVRNGVLVFDDVYDYIFARDFANKASNENVDSWHRSIGFKSLYKIYSEMDSIPEIGYLARLLSANGAVQVGRILHVVQNNTLYSFENNNLALNGNSSFENIDIYSGKLIDSHPIFTALGANGKAVERSGCLSYPRPAAAIFSPVVNTSGNRRISSATHVIIDESAPTQGTDGGKGWMINYGRRITFKHQRKMLIGWSCERTVWDYTAQHSLTTNAFNTPPPGVFPDVISNNVSGSFRLQTGFECDYAYQDNPIHVLLQGDAVGVKNMWSSRKVNGTVSFNCTAQESGLTASASCTK